MKAAVVRAVGGEERVAVAFSGGLDSSIIAKCAAEEAEVVACTCYAEGAGDFARATDAAKMLDVALAATVLTPALVAGELRGMDLPFQATLMDRSLWCLYSLVSKSAKEAGARVMLLGQLADELFGGYAKYADALRRGGSDAARFLMESDLKGYSVRGKVRDTRACERWVEARLPFEDLIGYAASVPTSFKLKAGVRKAILRSAAVKLGVPEELALAPKKAAQYSSGVQKLVASAPFNAPA